VTEEVQRGLGIAEVNGYCSNFVLLRSLYRAVTW
jgi:hypothetical protein